MKPKTRSEEITEARAPSEAQKRALAEVDAISNRALALQQIWHAHIERFPHLAAPVIQIAKDIDRSTTILAKMLDPQMFINAGLSANPDEDD